jgi:hypothetical protein
MRRFVLGWKMLGLERSLGTRIVTYADDLVGQVRGLLDIFIGVASFESRVLRPTWASYS